MAVVTSNPPELDPVPGPGCILFPDGAIRTTDRSGPIILPARKKWILFVKVFRTKMDKATELVPRIVIGRFGLSTMDICTPFVAAPHTFSGISPAATGRTDKLIRAKMKRIFFI